jgi:hypothetical protein
MENQTANIYMTTHRGTSLHHGCCGKAMSITCSECVCSLSYPECKAHTPYYVICDLSGLLKFNKSKLCGDIFENYLKIHFMKIRRVGKEGFHTDVQTQTYRHHEAGNNFSKFCECV